MISDTMVNGNLKDDDPQVLSIPATLARICICIKEDFKPVLPMILPTLIKDATRELDFKTVDVDDARLGLESSEDDHLRTSAIEIKLNAIEIIKNLARNMGKAFHEHVNPVAKICLEKLMCDRHDEDIRKQAAKAMRFCIAACKGNDEHQKQLFGMSFMRLMDELEIRKGDFDQTNMILKELYKQLLCFMHFKEKKLTIFSDDDVERFLNKLLEMAELCVQEKDIKMKEIKGMQGEVDAEDIRYYYEDHQKIHGGLHHIMEIHEVLMQNHGWHISPIVAQKFLPIYSEPLLKIAERQDYELNDSICFLCDCL